MEIKLHNTLTRSKTVFEPLDSERIGVYVCGPTVYDRIHIGNARPFVVFDVLFRLLRHTYGQDHVIYARNITDIDDKIINRAREHHIGIDELTEQTSQAFFDDVEALGCLVPTHQPRATQHVGDMISIIEQLIEQRHAYEADGHVLFEVATCERYGALSGRSRDEQIAGARVEVAPYKRDAADFVLWKPSREDEPGWDSPWGNGRPGWHIECSAMSERFLGVPFDIHGGGIDLIFPHHENEIAQSCCARDQPRMANYWMHNGFVDMRGEKMAKSTGNILSVADALTIAPGEAIRLWLLSAHYRQPLDYTETGLARARATLDRFYASLERTPDEGSGTVDREVLDGLADDLNTPKAIAALHELAGAVNRGERPAKDLKASAAMLGLLQQDPVAWRQGGADDEVERVDALIDERIAARKARNFARADEIRDQLTGMGIALEDGPDGTVWRRTS